MTKIVVIGVGAAALCAAASAATITPGFTFSVADAFGGPSGVGTHFHSSTGGDFGNPAGLAEVGDLADEEARGLSEYSLAGLLNGTAFVTFNVYDADGGLFGQSGFDGQVIIEAYNGNNAEDLSDFQAMSLGTVATFNTSSLDDGDVLSFDITSLYNTFIDNNEDSLGIRLRFGTDPFGTAIVFNNFRLTSESESTVIPLPTAGALGFMGITVIGARRRRVAR